MAHLSSLASVTGVAKTTPMHSLLACCFPPIHRRGRVWWFEWRQWAVWPATSLDIPLKSLTFLWLLFVHVWWSSSCTTSTVRFGSFTFLTSPPLFLLYVHSSIFPPDLASLTAAFVGFPPTNRLHLPIIFSSLDPCFLYVSISGFLVFYSLLWFWDQWYTSSTVVFASSSWPKLECLWIKLLLELLEHWLVKCPQGCSISQKTTVWEYHLSMPLQFMIASPS